jgi:peroxiredoxin
VPSSVSFEPLTRDQEPLDFRLKIETPEPPAPPKVDTEPEKQLIKMGEELERLNQELSKVLAGGKAGAEQVELIKQNLPLNLLAGRLLDLARANPNDPVVIGALAPIFQGAAASAYIDWPVSKARDEAIDQVIERHLENPDIGILFTSLQYGTASPTGETLLRAALARSPHREVRAAACYELARFLLFMAGAPETVRTLKEKTAQGDPDSLKSRIIGLRILERFAGVDSAKARTEAEELLERVKREFADVPQARFQAEGPGNIRLSRDVSPGANTKTYGALADQALFEIRELAVGKPAPDIEGADADGVRFKLSDYRGKVVLRTFSGNWCGPCRARYPQERELLSRLKDRPFVILSVNTDPEQETLRKSIRDGEITWRCWWDGGQGGPISSRWNILSFPTVFVIDAKGLIRAIGTHGKELEQTLERLVEEAQPKGRS